MSFNYTVSICRVEIIIVENWFLPDSFVQVPTEIRSRRYVDRMPRDLYHSIRLCSAFFELLRQFSLILS